MSEKSSVAEGEARAAEIRRDVEAAEARRSEEEVATAEQHVTEATKEQEKLSRRARRKREKAEKAAQAAQAAREQADQAAAEAERRAAETVSSVSGAAVSSPGIGASTPPHAAAAANAPGFQPVGAGPPSETPLTERPEVLIGAAFAGSFIFARVLKRLVD
jgi:colicin import membrane protein